MLRQGEYPAYHKVNLLAVVNSCYEQNKDGTKHKLQKTGQIVNKLKGQIVAETWEW